MHKIDQNFLEHFGILGMKWGVRRSRKQLGYDDAPEKHSSDYKTATSLKGKRLSEMSNKELMQLNQRLQLEQSYSTLTRRPPSVGKKILDKVLEGIGNRVLKIALKEAENAVRNKLLGAS